ncbi:MAG: hypothetical protein CMJ75_12320 [Planctomycetaceae bacterium]|nr:hypothetical protein [Planctomycetaceae bacterium]
MERAVGCELRHRFSLFAGITARYTEFRRAIALNRTSGYTLLYSGIQSAQADPMTEGFFKIGVPFEQRGTSSRHGKRQRSFVSL